MVFSGLDILSLIHPVNDNGLRWGAPQNNSWCMTVGEFCRV
jgi:hypothetical protein